jgi:hypothetical protein
VVILPTVFHEVLQVKSEVVPEGVGEGTGGEGKTQTDEDEYRRYGRKDPDIQLLPHSYMNMYIYFISGGRPKGNSMLFIMNQ